jgi:hypothetical protein
MSGYLAFWLVFGSMIHTSVNSLFASKNNFFILKPLKGNPKVVLSSGHEYKKVGQARPCSYVLTDAKPSDIHFTTGLIFSANPTEQFVLLHEIDVIDNIDNKIFTRGTFEYDEKSLTHVNRLDVSNLPHQMSLLSLQLRNELNHNERVEKLYEQSKEFLDKERSDALIREGTYTRMLANNAEHVNIPLATFSKTTTALENRKIDAKLGSDARINETVDQKIQELEARLSQRLENIKKE